MRNTVKFLVLVPLFTALAGCYAANAPEVAGPASIQDRELLDAWSLPLDEYAPRDQRVVSRAASEDFFNCLRINGVPVKKVDVDIAELRDAPSEMTNVVGRRIFNEAVASNFGYRYSGADVEPDYSWPENAPLPDSSPLAEDCSAAAGSSLPGSPEAPVQFSLASKAYWDAKEDGRVAAAADSWRDCLARVSDFDLPDRPEEMPTAAMASLLDFDNEVLSRPVSEDEKELATQDAACRERSGYTWTFYSVESEYSAAALAENRAVLEAERDLFEAQLAFSVEFLTN